MRINQNLAAMNAYRSSTTNQSGLDRAMERLSSGLRINRAADDAAGLAISETMRAQVNGLSQAVSNTHDGINLMQTAEGSLNEDHAILQRMRTLAVQAATGTNSKENLQQIQAEIDQLMAQIDQIADSTQFNGMPLLDGTFVKKNFQIGANAGDTKEVTIGHPISSLVPPTSPAYALWGLDDAAERAKIPNPFVVQQNVTAAGETITVSVDLPDPPPATATELADVLRADPNFSASFDVAIGDWKEPDIEPRIGVNLGIMAKTPGAGGVTVLNTESFARTQARAGSDEIPAEYGGYHAAELLGGPIDVTREAGSTTTTPTTPPSDGYWSPTGDLVNEAYVWVPANSGGTGDPITQTWASGASDAIERIDRAIARVSRGRTEMGATQNVLAWGCPRLTDID
ncbi:flagellin N-terminal helical domain-containing protein [Mobilicoccus massiliensis]|uniref:flagellin N-terminal helical domain-containing protein n=1 Tax=Mobilicoccus massiliensis TaxID=1522310 RepID=UPI000694D58D|nr:hypothetical protein [Mobilicoccus massiliensis]